MFITVLMQQHFIQSCKSFISLQRNIATSYCIPLQNLVNVLYFQVDISPADLSGDPIVKTMCQQLAHPHMQKVVTLCHI